jgi:hypothetical protein
VVALGGTATAVEPLRPETRATLADLGWTADEVLTNDKPKVSVQFRLPDGSKQGHGSWYALRLAFEWHGMPRDGEIAYLYARWNGAAMYQFKMTNRRSRNLSGSEWSMVDAIWGGSGGIEFTDDFRAASTNYATIAGIVPGDNTIEFELDLDFTSAKDLTVRIMRESAVIATRWGPTDVQLRGTADIHDRALVLDLTLRNSGIGARQLALHTVVTYGDGTTDRFANPLDGGIGPLEGRDVRLNLDLTRADISSVHVMVDWGTGRAPFRVWPLHDRPWWRPQVPGLSWPGAAIALAALWIALPTAIRAARKAP